ncbi:MAG: YeeE/YedE family protein [Rhodobacteraceae bacterium]|nr:YeeE/YedE family protein [Paracoccaceae bacterium]
MRLLSVGLIGVLFGVGILVSGMASPAKVLNFFDVGGAWDPSLMFVMGGALTVTLLGYRFVLSRSAPLFDGSFHLPVAHQLDARLLGGAAVFGVGWGIAGFCPGGVLPAIGTGRADVLIFVASLIVGMLATDAWGKYIQRCEAAQRE